MTPLEIAVGLALAAGWLAIAALMLALLFSHGERERASAVGGDE